MQIETALAHIAAEAALATVPYLRGATRSDMSLSTKKNFHDPVTIHDRAVEAALLHIFSQAVPHSLAVGEENGDATLDPATYPERPDVTSLPATTRFTEAAATCRDLGPRVRWFIDPIDGTANFAAGLPWFATSIGVELDGSIVAGAITAPLLGALWAADHHNAWYEGPEGRRTLNAQGPRTAKESVLIAYHGGNETLKRDLETTAAQELRLHSTHMSVRRTGAGALDLAHVAAGWVGGMLGACFGPWDVAAGIHLVRVAGGTVLNENIAGDLPDGLRPAVLASCAGLDLSDAREVFYEVVAAHRDRVK
ncbi:MAG: inositol monophosphatase [Actinomycetaceae bacterium]|nr:inositol monophosphatase [Actinomycetaceae bacterium]